MTFYLDGDAAVGALLLRAPTLDLVDGVAHGFATRAGGRDFGRAAPLRSESVRRLACRLSFGDAHVYHAAQVHGARVLEVDGRVPAALLAGEQADALLTSTPGILVGVLTADCVPVLLADDRGRVVAAAHAGWRGLVGGVLEATVAAMVARGTAPERIVAAVGPCIGPAAYEVGEEVATGFADLEGVVRRGTRNSPRGAGGAPGQRPHVDLALAAARRLTGAGLRRCALASRCTYEEAELFHSYRRAGASAGRQLNVIGLRG